MKYWQCVERDAYSYFDWFSGVSFDKKLESTLNLSVFSINGSMIFNQEDKKMFFEMCNKAILQLFHDEEELKDYKLYLLITVELNDKKSIVERYKKAWKVLKVNWNLDNLILGPEIEERVGNKHCFTSMAEIPLKDFQIALEIVASNPNRNTIVAFKEGQFLTEELIKDMFNNAFINNQKIHDNINHFSLSQYFCAKGDIIFRWGDSSEECELDLIFSEDMLKLFT